MAHTATRLHGYTGAAATTVNCVPPVHLECRSPRNYRDRRSIQIQLRPLFLYEDVCLLSVSATRYYLLAGGLPPAVWAL